MLNSKIEWTDTTWNPVRGCSRVSRGCEHCYAERVAHRFSGAGQPYEGLTQLVNGHPVWTGKVTLVEEHLLDPLRWKPVLAPCGQCGLPQSCVCAGRDIHGPVGPLLRPRRIFVNSMSDLFHENVPDAWIDRIFAVMALCPQHTFQVLTKRPERMRAYATNAPGRLADVIETMRFDDPRRAVGPLPHLNGGERWYPVSNVHLGVSVEDQKTADERIPLLLQTPAAVRFVSAEPMLGAIDLLRLPREGQHHDYLTGEKMTARTKETTPRLDWVICGGESGPNARPMHPDWARDLRDQCVAAGVPFFFKQWGEFSPVSATKPGEEYPKTSQLVRADGRSASGVSATDVWMQRVGKKAAGALLDGREWKEFPQ